MLKVIKDYPNYYVSDKGKIVHTTARGIFESNGVQHKDGDYRILLTNRTQWVVVKLKELVAEYYLDNPNGYTKVLHKDKHLDNNSADNLEYVSDEEYDKTKLYKNGAELHEIKGYDMYLISDHKEIYTMKGVSMEKMKLSPDKRVAIKNDASGFKNKTTDWWYKRRKEEFSRKDFNKRYNKFHNNDENHNVINLITGEKYKTIKEAAYVEEKSISTITQHCNDKVKYPLYCYEKDWDGELLYTTRVRNLENNEIYKDITEAKIKTGDTVYTIYKHCNEKKINNRYEYV